MSANTAILQRRLARMVATLTLYEADLTAHPPTEVLTRYFDEGVDRAILTADSGEAIDPEGVQLVDRDQLTGKTPCSELFLGIESGLLDDDGRAFARELVEGVTVQTAAIGQIIAQVAPDWPAAQLAAVDRNVLRIAIYELVFEEAARPAVVIDDAVELGKCFGSDSSSRFINGVLGNVANRANRYRRKYAEVAIPAQNGESDG